MGSRPEKSSSHSSLALYPGARPLANVSVKNEISKPLVTERTKKKFPEKIPEKEKIRITIGI